MRIRNLHLRPRILRALLNIIQVVPPLQIIHSILISTQRQIASMLPNNTRNTISYSLV